MDVKLNRDLDLPTRTGGKVFINGEFFCYSCEDDVREVPGMSVEDWKVVGKTAIPVGRYRLTLENSPKFGPDCPTVNDVPGFKYIRIHSGNNENDTEGCLLFGYGRNTDGTINSSRLAITEFKRRMKEAVQKNEEVWLEIS